jgi:hypothetical protein
MTRYALKLELLRLAEMLPEHAAILREAESLIPDSPLYEAADSRCRELMRHIDLMQEEIDDLRNYNDKLDRQRVFTKPA